MMPSLLLKFAHILSTGTKSKSKVRKEQISFSLLGVFYTLYSLWGFITLRVGIG